MNLHVAGTLAGRAGKPQINLQPPQHEHVAGDGQDGVNDIALIVGGMAAHPPSRAWPPLHS